MPGTLLLDDWRNAVTDRLQQHAQNTLQAVQQANQPPLQAVTIPTPPIDPNEVAQRLQQHAQDAWGAIQQANQPPLQAVTIDPNDITQRLQQHAQDAFQSIDQNVQSIGQGLQNVQQAVQPAVQQAQQTAQDVQNAVQPTTSDQQQSFQDQTASDRVRGQAEVIAQASAKTGVPSSVIAAIMDTEAGGPNSRSSQGASGFMQVLDSHFKPGENPFDPLTNITRGAEILADNFQRYGSWDKAAAAYFGAIDASGNITNARDAGGTTGTGYVGRFLTNLDKYGGDLQGAVGGAVETGRQAVANAVLPTLSQFGDRELNSAEAYAACGPAAAVRFAQMFGRNPTLREAVDLAKGVGWTQDSGMAGLQSESKLFTDMGIPHRVVGADWQALAREAASGNPVTISTPGHYFTADSFDPSSGAFHVGSSGTDLRGGAEWMTPSQMEQRMGALQGGLAADNPGTPAPSPISGGTTAVTGLIGQARQAVQQGGRAIAQGLQSLDRTIQDVSAAGPSTGAGQAVASFDQGRQDLADRISASPQQIQDAFAANQANPPLAGVREQIANAPVLGGVLGMARGPALLSDEEVLRTPEAETARTLLEQINARAAAKGVTPPPVSDADVADATRTLLTSQAVAMTGEGFGRPERAAPSAPAVPAAAEAPEVPATRMYHGTGTTFDQVNPGHLSEDSLFGPGYYVTSDPRVAGGVVQATSEPLTPIQQSLVDRGLLRPENARSQAGAVVTPGYAQEMAAPPETSDVLVERANKIRQALQNPSLPPSGRSQLEDLLTKADAAVREAAGPNVRAVDVPNNLNLFDLERPLTTDEATRVANALGFDPSDPEVRSWSTPDVDGKSVYDLILGETGGNKGEANLILSRAGFDGISHTGGRIMPMVDQAGQTIEHDVNVIFPDAVGKVRNAISGTQGGQINAAVAARLGGAAAGGYAGYQSTPEDASPAERLARTAVGAGAGTLAAGTVASAARFRGPLEQQVLENLRSAGLQPSSRVPPPPPPNSPLRQQWLTGTGPWAPQPARGPIAQAVDFTKQSILSNPATHIANVIGNTIELARQPVALAIGGRSDDAMAGLAAIARGLPEAAQNAVSALRGRQLATLATEGGAIPRSSPIFRALSASDAFTRTLGEYQGMAAEANRLLREAGMTPGDPGAASYLASHAQDLYREGTRAGAQSVFGRVASTGQGTGVLDNIFKTYSSAKETLLNSPRLRDQAMGALMDFAIPFSGIPVQMLQIGLNRLPVAAQATGAVRAVRALKAGDVAGAQRAVGETGLESAIQLMIGKQVADGNITGPDDPVHPNSVRVGGNWVSMNEWGAYALPMQIMASFADGYEKGGQDVPASTPGASALEKTANYYGPRFSAALNASLKPFQQGIPGENLIRLVSNIGQGGATAGALGLLQDAVNRITVPGAARFLENLTDPVARDINRKGVSSLWEGTMSNWPGLAELLPSKIDPTTGEVLNKARTGAGILVGGQQDVASPLTIAAADLRKAGFKDVVAPKAYPADVTVGGAKVSLSPSEQRAVAQITGQRLKELAQRLDTPGYQNAPDPQKAEMLKAWINAADTMREAAAIQVVGRAAFFQRAQAMRQTAGRLNVQAEPPDELAFFNPTSSQHALQQRSAALAGTP